MAADATQDYRVKPDLLRRLCSLPADFSQDAEAKVDAHIGQQRAIDAIRFGIAMRREGYNIYVLGPIGSNRHELVNDLVTAEAKARGAPHDWCYVNNFEDTNEPRALRLPVGRGSELVKDMENVVEDLRTAIPAALEMEEHKSRIQEIQDQMVGEGEGEERPRLPAGHAHALFPIQGLAAEHEFLFGLGFADFSGQPDQGREEATVLHVAHPEIVRDRVGGIDG